MWPQLKHIIHNEVSSRRGLIIYSVLFGLMFFGEPVSHWCVLRVIQPFLHFMRNETPQPEPVHWTISWPRLDDCYRPKELLSLPENELLEVDSLVLGDSLWNADEPEDNENRLAAYSSVSEQLSDWRDRLPQLTVLMLKNVPLSRALMEEVAQCESLELLGLIDCEISAENLEPLNEHPKLRAIDLSGSHFAGANPLSPLATVPTLRVCYSMNSETAFDELAVALLDVPQLLGLVVNAWYSPTGENGLSPNGIKSLAQHEHLRTLWLRSDYDDPDRDLAPHLSAMKPELKLLPLNFTDERFYVVFWVALMEFMLLCALAVPFLDMRTNSSAALIPHHFVGTVGVVGTLWFLIIAAATTALWLGELPWISIVSIHAFVMTLVLTGFVLKGWMICGWEHARWLWSVALFLVIAPIFRDFDKNSMAFVYGDLTWPAWTFGLAAFALLGIGLRLFWALPQRVEEVAPKSPDAARTATFDRSEIDDWMTRLDRRIFESRFQTLRLINEVPMYARLRLGTRCHGAGIVFSMALLALCVVGFCGVLFELHAQRPDVDVVESIQRFLGKELKLLFVVLCVTFLGQWCLLRMCAWLRRRTLCNAEFLRPVSRAQLKATYFSAITFDFVAPVCGCMALFVVLNMTLGWYDWDLRVAQIMILAVTCTAALIAIALEMFTVDRTITGLSVPLRIAFVPLILFFCFFGLLQSQNSVFFAIGFVIASVAGAWSWLQANRNFDQLEFAD